MDFWTITTLFPHFNPFLIHLYSLQDTNLPVDGFCQHQDSLKCKPSHPQCWLNDRPPKCRSSTSSSRRAASPATPLQVRHLDQFKLDHLLTGRESGPPQQHLRGFSLESDEGDVEDNRAASIASSRSNMSEQSADAASPLVAGGNPRISAPLQNTSLGSGAGLQGLPQANSKPKCHQFLIRYKAFNLPLSLSAFVLPINLKLATTLLAFNLIAANLFHQL